MVRHWRGPVGTRSGHPDTVMKSGARCCSDDALGSSIDVAFGRESWYGTGEPQGRLSRWWSSSEPALIASSSMSNSAGDTKTLESVALRRQLPWFHLYLLFMHLHLISPILQYNARSLVSCKCIFRSDESTWIQQPFPASTFPR